MRCRWRSAFSCALRPAPFAPVCTAFCSSVSVDTPSPTSEPELPFANADTTVPAAVIAVAAHPCCRRNAREERAGGAGIAGIGDEVAHIIVGKGGA